MDQLLLGCALGFLFVACAAAPFIAPWRIRIRYLVAAQVADPVFGVGPPREITLHEVHVTNVEAERGHVDLVLEETPSSPSARRRVFTRDECAPATVAQLDGWSATHEALLMVMDERGDIHLYGPDGAVTLRPAGAA